MKLAVVYEDGSFASKARDEEQGNGDGSKGKNLDFVKVKYLAGKPLESLFLVMFL